MNEVNNNYNNEIYLAINDNNNVGIGKITADVFEEYCAHNATIARCTSSAAQPLETLGTTSPQKTDFLTLLSRVTVRTKNAVGSIFTFHKTIHTALGHLSEARAAKRALARLELGGMSKDIAAFTAQKILRHLSEKTSFSPVELKLGINAFLLMSHGLHRCLTDLNDVMSPTVSPQTHKALQDHVRANFVAEFLQKATSDPLSLTTEDINNMHALTRDNPALQFATDQLETLKKGCGKKEAQAICRHIELVNAYFSLPLSTPELIASWKPENQYDRELCRTVVDHLKALAEHKIPLPTTPKSYQALAKYIKDANLQNYLQLPPHPTYIQDTGLKKHL